MYKKTYYQMQTLIRWAVFYLIVFLILVQIGLKGYKAVLDTPLHPIPKNTTNSNK